ncbi:ABC transporter ATP-binding protein [Streptococcus mitis]|nr:ABC transporter ATP-binding protein [Streptococcus sp. NLN76]MBG9367217.1 ABC transporter ATP-binding protein [Streptococcus sp. NLN64]
MQTLFSHVKISTKMMLGLLLFMAIGTAGEMVLPTMLSMILEDGVRGNSQQAVITYALIMVISLFVSFLAMLVANLFSSKIAARLARDLRQAVFTKISNLSAKEFDKFGTASLVTRSTADIVNIQEFTTVALQFGLMGPFLLAAGLILSISTGGQLSLVLVVSVPLMIIVTSILGWLSIRYSTRLRELLDQLNRRFLEMLEGVRVIRAFNKQDFETSKFDVINQDYKDTAITNGRIMNILNPFINLVFGLTNAGILIVGSFLLANREISVGSIVANTEYVAIILFGILIGLFIVSMLPTTLTCIRRVAEVLGTESSIRDGDKLMEKAETVTVEFKNVTFGYDDAAEPVLHHLNFTTKPGQITAFIGRTASGKSSILKLIPRLYDVRYGEIKINGINIKDYKLQDLRDLIGYVPQKNVLFTGDIASNLNFGNENGQEEDWQVATDIASATEFIQGKEGGFHASISQGGSNLSGGQRQRMAIARALMKKAPLYLFDDSLSALDMKTDQAIRHRFRTDLADANIMIVAQRISSIMSADQIIVIDKGEIVGIGTHQELLESTPLYREIAELQLGKEALDHA